MLSPPESTFAARRLVPLAPYLPVESVADGQKASVTGQVHCTEPLVAPLSGVSCACYELALWCLKRSNRHPVAVESKLLRFSIVSLKSRDRVLCDAPRAWVTGAAHACAVMFQGRRDVDPVGAIAGARALLHEARDQLEGDCWLTESFLPNRCLVAAWGHFRVELEGQAYRAPASRLLHLEASPSGPPWVTDDVTSALRELGQLPFVDSSS